MGDNGFSGLDQQIAALVAAGWRERDALKEALVELAMALPDRDAVLKHIGEARDALTDLELRWELDEVVEALTPVPDAEPEPEEVEEEAKESDFVLVYDDPRGLQLYRTKDGEQWVANQTNPQTGQPQSFAVPPEQLVQLKESLKGSPYWVLGAGGITS
ncbi:MAG: hypothetical protein ACJATT_000393 [Myxococcota bacterium]|jgi:hypothetical protein